MTLPADGRRQSPPRGSTARPSLSGPAGVGARIARGARKRPVPRLSLDPTARGTAPPPERPLFRRGALRGRRQIARHGPRYPRKSTIVEPMLRHVRGPNIAAARGGPPDGGDVPRPPGADARSTFQTRPGPARGRSRYGRDARRQALMPGTWAGVMPAPGTRQRLAAPPLAEGQTRVAGATADADAPSPKPRTRL
jgi:hypothetical protein